MRNKYTHQQLHQQEEHHHQQQQQRSTRTTKFLPMLCSLSTKQLAIKLISPASHRRCSSTASSSEDPLSPRVGCMGQVKRNNKVVGFPPTNNNNNKTTTREAATQTTNTTTFKCHEQIINNYSYSYNSNGAIVKYHMLNKFFTPKGITSSPTTTAAAANAAVTVARSRAHKCHGKSGGRNGSSNNSNRGIRDHDDDYGHSQSVIPRSKIDENCTHNRVNLSRKKKSNKDEDEDEKGSFVNLMDLDPPLPVMKVKQKQEEEGDNNGEKNNNVSLWKRRSKGAPLKSLQVQVQVSQHTTCNNHLNLSLEPTTV